MATSEQLKALLKAHYEQNNERFSAIALQVAAYEAGLGHTNIAYDIKSIIDHSANQFTHPNELLKKVEHLLFQSTQTNHMQSLVMSKTLKSRIENIIYEYRNRHKLSEHGLTPRRKILLAGDPGTGKTMTATVIATELKLPLMIVQIDRLISRYMGETATTLRDVFECINQVPAIYLFDEFDVIATERQRTNDVGEIGRVVSAFLQFLEQSHSSSIIITATNSKDVLDKALFRRYDDILIYERPSCEEIKQLLELYLGKYDYNIDFEVVVNKLHDFSHAEIAKICLHTIKQKILKDINQINTNLIIEEIDLWNTYK